MATDKKTSSKEAKSQAKPEDKGTPKSEAKQASAKAGKPAKKAAKAGKGKGSKKEPGARKRPQLVGKSFRPRAEDVDRQWHVIDAKGQVLGRLSTLITTRLMGKHKPQYTPGVDVGDFVVVTNAKRVRLTGKKVTDKWYHYHTHYPGGVKSFTPKDLFEKHPERVIERAVYGMLPHTHLGRKWYRRLKVYAGDTHPHKAQVPAGKAAAAAPASDQQ